MRRFAKSLKADMSSEGSNPSLSVVTVVQLVEQRVVIPHVVGSNPISHPLARSTTVVHPAVNGTVEGSNPSEPVPLLCNGSTGDFDSSSYGSNPYEGMFGSVLKRPTRADCKSADYVYGGSNPSAPIHATLAQR